MKERVVIPQVKLSIALFVFTLASVPAAAFAISYLPGQTLNPSCLPTDSTCIVAALPISAGSILFGNGTATAATSSSLFWDNIDGRLGIGTTSPFTSLAIAGNEFLSGNLSVGDATATRTNLGLPYATSNQAGWYNITTWGDSLTAGNEDGTGVSYPNQLAADLPGSVVNNEGVGGQTSTQIAVREGGAQTNATVSGGTIPASGSVTVTFPSGYEPVTSQGPSPGTYGTIDGVQGLVTLSGSTYTFNVLNGTTTVSVSGAVPFIPSIGSLNNGTVILWEGRNNSGNISQVESDIAASVAAIPSNRYLILSVENGEGEGTGTGTYTNITTINSYLAATYSGHYLDVREYLVQHGMAAAGLTPTSQDLTDISNDIPPTSLRVDNIHLNAAGYKVIAAQVANWITNFDSSNTAVVTYSQLPNLLAGMTLPGLTIASTTYSIPLGSTTTISTSLASLFSIASNTAPTSPDITVLSNGLVGFGTSTPNSVVQIEGPPNPGGNSFTGTTHLGLFLTSMGYGMSGLDFGTLNSVNPEARIAMTVDNTGSYLNLGTTGGWSSGITNDALTINPGGYIGVGTSTPLSALHVYSRSVVSSFMGSTTHELLTLDGDNYTGIDFADAGGVGNRIPKARIAMTTGASGSYLEFGTTNNWNFGIDNTALTVDPNGNVGVGTTTPLSALHVHTTSSISTFTGIAHLGLTLDGAGYTGIDFTDVGGAGNIYPKARIAMTENSNGSYLQFGTTNSWTAGIDTTAMTIDYNGRIGIGTTTPLTSLQVVQASPPSTFTGTGLFGLFVSSPTYGMSGIDFGGENAPNNPEARIAMTTGIGAGSALEFGTSNNFSSGITTLAMTIGPFGNVAIGTTTPYSRLEVFGPDTASTSAFAVVNSASTTEFSVYDTGNATLAGGLIQNSDQRLKTNIQSLSASSSLSLIDQLNPVTFNWIDPNKGSTSQLGFIAQQVLPIFPNLVSTTSATALTPDGTLSLNYIDLISPIVSAIQALSSNITSIENTIAGFATIFHTQELCVGSTCVTPQQFQAMVAAAGASQGGGTPSSSATDSNASSTPDTLPVIQVNGDNPAIVQVGATYNDLGATITGPQTDLNLGISTLLNGTHTSNLAIDTSAAATDTIDYVVTDQNGLTSTSTRTVIVRAPTVSNTPTGSASSTVSAPTSAPIIISAPAASSTLSTTASSSAATSTSQ